MADEAKTGTDKAHADTTALLEKILGRLESVTSRMDAMETEAKDRKDAEEKEKSERDCRDNARKDRFGKRHDGETFKDYKARHDADETAMCDALEKGGIMKDRARKDAADCRRDAEDEERRNDETFEQWAKEESEEESHKDRKDRKDAEEKEEREREERAEKDRKDAAMVAENADLRSKLAAVERTIAGITAETTAEDRNALATAQSRADGISGLFGSRAPAPVPGESPLAYRRRLAKNFQAHSEKFKSTRFDSLDEGTFGTIEEIIYKDAADAARSPGRAGVGTLIAIREPDEAGRMITRYVGDNLAWMQMFMTPGRVGKFVRPT